MISPGSCAVPMPGSDHQRIAHYLDQSSLHSSPERQCAVQGHVVGRTLFQMDQATARQHLRIGSNRSEASKYGFVAAFNVARFERTTF
jgi:hypothetical protein